MSIIGDAITASIKNEIPVVIAYSRKPTGESGAISIGTSPSGKCFIISDHKYFNNYGCSKSGNYRIYITISMYTTGTIQLIVKKNNSQTILNYNITNTSSFWYPISLNKYDYLTITAQQTAGVYNQDCDYYVTITEGST